jgi:hypothetical protein
VRLIHNPASRHIAMNNSSVFMNWDSFWGRREPPGFVLFNLVSQNSKSFGKQFSQNWFETRFES